MDLVHDIAHLANEKLRDGFVVVKNYDYGLKIINSFVSSSVRTSLQITKDERVKALRSQHVKPDPLFSK